MRLLVVAILCLPALFGQPQPPQPPPEVKPEDKCSIEGTILNGATGEPLAKAKINLQRTDTTAGYMLTSYGATTDASGHYSITGVDPGKYMLMAQRNGFVNTSYGAKSQMTPGTALNLTPASALKKLDIKMTPHGVVNGRIVDEDGEPVPYVQVMLSRFMYSNGRRSLAPMGGNSATNDKGEYRIFGAAPGRYYVSAIYRDFNRPPNEIRSDPAGDYAPVYYPSSTSPQNAVAIDVVAGRELTGIDLRLARQKLPSVSGQITNFSQSTPTNVMLTARDRSMGFGMEMKNGMADSKGRFTIRGVTPGRYTVVAMPMMGGAERQMAYAHVDVTTQNVENVTLTFGPQATISGVLRIEGRQDLGDLKANPPRITFQPVDGGFMFGGAGAVVKEDGSFEVKNVGPGRYRVWLPMQNDSYFVKSVRLGNTEVTDSVIDMSNPPSEMGVTISNRGAQVQGVVKESKDKPAPSSMVVLVPEDTEKSHLFKVANSDQDGKFTMKNIPPGRYRLFAWDSVEPGSWQDPDFLKQFENDAVSILLGDAAQETKDLKLLHGTP